MTKKILVVDDDPMLITYLKTLLEDNGYEVISAKDGNEGLEKTKKEKPDAITLDLLMPGKTGIKMFHELRKDESLKNIPVIVVTGIVTEYQGFSNFKEFLSKQKIPAPEAYLEKPIKKKNLSQP
jgi:Response regulator containing CheY-like receiver, AAA-type ATPase, and DNA-binding domains